jgi:hypothetical protein
MVGHRLYALLHSRHHFRLRFGLCKYIRHCRKQGLLASSETLQADRSKITAYLAAGLVFTTSAVNSLVYSSDAAKEAAAAGFILLSMVAVGRNQRLPINTP